MLIRYVIKYVSTCTESGKMLYSLNVAFDLEYLFRHSLM